MFLLSKPTGDEIRKFISSQADQEVSYPREAGLAPGYKVDHNRVRLGAGAAVFQSAVSAVNRWEMFNINWLKLCWPDAPIEVGSNVAVLARHYGFWSLHACRIVRVIDEDGSARRYGFAYGTLPDHAERGQESFTIEWRRDDDSVWYDIMAYSKPNHLLAKLGYPLTRSLQKRFARESLAAMVRSCGGC